MNKKMLHAKIYSRQDKKKDAASMCVCQKEYIAGRLHPSAQDCPDVCLFLMGYEIDFSPVFLWSGLVP